jgi:hypothetical protein
MKTEPSQMFFIGEFPICTEGSVVRAQRVREINATESLIPKAAQVLKRKFESEIEEKTQQLALELQHEKEILLADHLDRLAGLQSAWDKQVTELRTQVHSICTAVLLEIIGSSPEPRTLKLLSDLIQRRFNDKSNPVTLRANSRWASRVSDAMKFAGWKSEHYQIETDSYLEENSIVIFDAHGGIEINVEKIVSSIALQKIHSSQSMGAPKDNTADRNFVEDESAVEAFYSEGISLGFVASDD